MGRNQNGRRSRWPKARLQEARFMKLDCEGFAPKFFSSLFKNHSLLILSQTFKSSVDVVARTFTPAPLWGDIPAKENTRILLEFSLTNGIYGQEGCAHATDMCVCVCTHVRMSVHCLKCTLHFSLNVQNFQKLEGKKKLLHDSIENTMCCL